jgi:hypothetical protein
MSTNNEKPTAESIQRVLIGFIGTFNYYRNTVGSQEILLTDGCEYVRRELKAFWLFDLITTYQDCQALKGHDFQVWTLKKTIEDYWNMTCQDGNHNLLLSQLIKYSDFPIDEISVWLVEKVAMLPTEY